MTLAPCPSCQRHVHVHETVCPFCAALLSDAPSRRLVRMRVGRFAAFTINAALVGSVATACGTDSRPEEESEVTATGGVSEATGGSPFVFPTGGTPNGGGNGGAGGEAATGGDSGIPIYSAIPRP
jgi:hypothetical protein